MHRYAAEFCITTCIKLLENDSPKFANKDDNPNICQSMNKKESQKIPSSSTN